MSKLLFNPEWSTRAAKYTTEIEQQIKQLQIKQEELYKAGDVIELKDKYFDRIPVFINNELPVGKVRLKKSV